MVIDAASVALLLPDCSALLQRRGPGQPLEQYWAFPGGKILPGERAEECARRELWEETTLSAAELHFLGKQTVDHNRTIYLISVFCGLFDGEPTAACCREGLELKFFPRAAANTLRTAPAILEFWDKAIASLRQRLALVEG